jgi:hypothetical protein
MIPGKLRKAMEENNPVLFIGAGFSYEFKNEQGKIIEGWKNLVAQILLHLEAIGYEVTHLKPFVEIYDPIAILDLIEKDKSLPREEVISFVKDFFALSPDKNDYTLHRKLYELSGKIITTNYDNAFEIAQPLLERKTASIGRDYELSLLHNPYEPVLFKLHGCISDGHHMVLFPSNYDNLYRSQDENAERITFALQNLIYNKPLLFIGYGMGDFQINQILLHVKRLQGKYHQPHFIISKEPIDSRLTADNFLGHIKIENHSEIEGIIDELLRIKEEIGRRKYPEIDKLKKERDDANKTEFPDETSCKAKGEEYRNKHGVAVCPRCINREHYLKTDKECYECGKRRYCQRLKVTIRSVVHSNRLLLSTIVCNHFL